MAITAVVFQWYFEGVMWSYCKWRGSDDDGSFRQEGEFGGCQCQER